MPRAARLQFPGSLYHVLNRGNYRQDLFAVHRTGEVFERALFEACERFGWREKRGQPTFFVVIGLPVYDQDLMPRAARLQFPGALYHVLNRGNYRQDLFAVHRTGEVFERALFEACERFGWRVHAYVLMSNHFHLALETPRANLVRGMQWLESVFANRFNRFVEGRGHVFQRGGKGVSPRFLLSLRGERGRGERGQPTFFVVVEGRKGSAHVFCCRWTSCL